MIKNLDFSPGIGQPLCGWDWMRQHQYDEYPPVTFELTRDGVTHKMTIRKQEVI